MALEVQQGLGAAPAVAGAGHVVLVVPLVALHAVVRGQVLAQGCRAKRNEDQQATPSSSPRAYSACSARGSPHPTHNAAVLGIHALEVPGHLQDGLAEVSHQLRLLDVLGFQGLQVVVPWWSPRSQGEGEEKETKHKIFISY